MTTVSTPSHRGYLDAVVRAATVAVPVRPGAATGALTPTQLDLAAVIAAEDATGVPEFPFAAVSIGRRSGKTSTVLACVVARCLVHPGHRAFFAAQTLLKSVDRMRDLAQTLQAAGAPWVTPRWSNGSERLLFDNGSELRFGSPRPETFRSEAFDTIVLDESQEHDGDRALELRAAALPTLDTRPQGQLIVAGTPGSRTSLLWWAVEQGRAARPGWALVEHSAEEEDDPRDPSVWHRVHPGLRDGLTTEAKLANNLDAIGPEAFGQEYLGRWLSETARGAIDGELWEACAIEAPVQPERFAVAFDVSPSGDRASVVAAWQVGDLMHVELLESQPGTDWVPGFVRSVAGTERPVGYDSMGRGNLWCADELARARPRPRLVGLSTADALIAASGLQARVHGATLRHSRQPGLTAAALGASRRPVGDSGWLFGRRSSQVDISPLVAASVASRTLDLLPFRSRPKIRTARTAA